MCIVRLQVLYRERLLILFKSSEIELMLFSTRISALPTTQLKMMLSCMKTDIIVMKDLDLEYL